MECHLQLLKLENNNAPAVSTLEQKWNRRLTRPIFFGGRENCGLGMRLPVHLMRVHTGTISIESVVQPHSWFSLLVDLFLQPISWTSLALMVVGGGLAVLYARKLKREKEEGESFPNLLVSCPDATLSPGNGLVSRDTHII